MSKRISELPEAGALSGNELMVVVQGGESRKSTFGNLKGEPGEDGADGVDGINGAPLTLKGKLDSPGDLPATGNAVGDAYAIAGVLWGWIGTSWEELGVGAGGLTLTLPRIETLTRQYIAHSWWDWDVDAVVIEWTPTRTGNARLLPFSLHGAGWTSQWVNCYVTDVDPRIGGDGSNVLAETDINDFSEGTFPVVGAQTYWIFFASWDTVTNLELDVSLLVGGLSDYGGFDRPTSPHFIIPQPDGSYGYTVKAASLLFPNDVTGENAFATGDRNTIVGSRGFAAGRDNTIGNAQNAALLGQGNEVTNGAHNAFSSGAANIIRKAYSAALGVGHDVLEDYAFVTGAYGLVSDPLTRVLSSGGFSNQKGSAQVVEQVQRTDAKATALSPGAWARMGLRPSELAFVTVEMVAIGDGGVDIAVCTLKGVYAGNNLGFGLGGWVGTPTVEHIYRQGSDGDTWFILQTSSATSTKATPSFNVGGNNLKGTFQRAVARVKFVMLKAIP